VSTCGLFLYQKADVGDTTTLHSNYVKLLKEYNDLAEGYERLQQHLDEETKFHQEQTSQNVAVMTEMQDTIAQLRNQLAELRSTRSASSGVSEQKYSLFVESMDTFHASKSSRSKWNGYFPAKFRDDGYFRLSQPPGSLVKTQNYIPFVHSYSSSVYAAKSILLF